MEFFKKLQDEVLMPNLQEIPEPCNLTFHGLGPGAVGTQRTLTFTRSHGEPSHEAPEHQSLSDPTEETSDSTEFKSVEHIGSMNKPQNEKYRVATLFSKIQEKMQKNDNLKDCYSKNNFEWNKDERIFYKIKIIFKKDNRKFPYSYKFNWCRNVSEHNFSLGDPIFDLKGLRPEGFASKCGDSNLCGEMSFKTEGPILLSRGLNHYATWRC
eukprot:GHVP01064757.1.p1 GENE.GHVP01064757.1~~GHVP01064757.1.p1  ORF type:complete len:211 (+),score=25.22 GHVP01064757.1:132-764(+)